MRNILFYSMLTILAFIIVSCVALFILVACNVIFQGSDITAMISIAISLISTVLTIPVIMTKSLFPPKEDNQIVEVLSKMLENDQNIRVNGKQNDIKND